MKYDFSSLGIRLSQSTRDYKTICALTQEDLDGYSLTMPDGSAVSGAVFIRDGFDDLVVIFNIGGLYTTSCPKFVVAEFADVIGRHDGYLDTNKAAVVKILCDFIDGPGRSDAFSKRPIGRTYSRLTKGVKPAWMDIEISWKQWLGFAGLELSLDIRADTN
jgi:hypothetical protein